MFNVDSSRRTDYDVADFVSVANELAKKLNKPQQFRVHGGISYAHAFQKARIYGQQLKPGHFKTGGIRCISKKAKKLLDEVYGINEDSIRQLIQKRSELTETTKQENTKMGNVGKKIADKIKAKKGEEVEDDDDLDFEDDDLEDDDPEDEDDDIEFEEEEEEESPAPKKRGPGRPKKNPVPDDDDDDEPVKKAPAKATAAPKKETKGNVPDEVVEAISTILNFLKS